MPELLTAGDAKFAAAALLQAVSKGELTPSEASELSKLVESFTRVLEVTDLEERLSRLEAKTNN